MADASENNLSSSESANSQKKEKIPFENLSKEELITRAKKYLNFLQITKKKYDELNGKYSALEKERDGNAETLAKLQLENEALQNLKSELSENELQKLELHSELEKIKGEKDAASKSYREAAEEVQCLKMKLDTLKETCQYLQDEVSKSDVSKKSLNNEINVLTAARDSALEELKKFKANHLLEIDKMKQQQIECEKKLAALEKRNQNIEDQNVCLSKKYESLCGESEAWKLKLVELKDEKERFNEDLQKLSFLEKENSELQSVLNKLKEKSNLFEKQNKSLENEKHELEETLATLHAKIEILNSELNACCNEKNVLKECIETKSAESEEFLNEIKEKNCTLEKKIEELKNEKNSVCKKFEAIDQENEVLKLKFQEYEIKINYIENLEQKLTEEKDKCIELQKCCEKLENDNSALCKKNKEINSKVVQLQNEFTKVYTDFKMMQQRIINFENETKKLFADLAAPNVLCVKCGSSQENSKAKLQTCNDSINSPLVKEDNKACNCKMNLTELESQKLQLLKQCEALENDNEILKQQLDEYENDIQKHLNLENENFELHSCLKDLERENYELNDRLENKCVELNELNTQLELLIVSIKQGAKQKSSVGMYHAENDPLQNVFILKSLCDDICSQLGNNSVKIRSLEADLANTLKQMQNANSELVQVKDLNQFLEDEIKELREEAEQTKVEHANNLQLIQSLESELQKQKEKAKTYEQNESKVLSTVVLDNKSIENVKEDKSLAPTFSEVISEWGCVEENSYERVSKCKNCNCEFEKYVLENERLSSLLEAKTTLVEKIHCQMDLQLSKIEELSQELEEKKSDLEKAENININLKHDLNELCALQSKQKRLLIDTANLMTTTKELKNGIYEDMNLLKTYMTDSLKDIATSLSSVLQSCDSYSLSVRKHEHINSNLQNELSVLKSILCELGQDIFDTHKYIIDKVFRGSNRNTEVSYQHTASLSETESVTKSMFDQAGKKLSENENSLFDVEVNCIEVLKQKLKGEMDLLKKDLCSVVDMNKQNESELSHYKQVLIPNLEKTISCFEAEHIAHEDLKNSPNVSSELEQSSKESSSLETELADTKIKMVKIKAVAIKVKKELAESKKMYNELLEEKAKYKKQANDLAEELNSVSSTHSQYVQNFQSLQMEYDKLQDQIEEYKATIKKLEGDFSSAKGELSNAKGKYSHMDIEFNKMKEILDTAVMEKNVKEQKYAELESKIIILESKYSESQNKIQELQSSILKFQNSEKEMLSEINKLKERLEIAQKAGKKHDLLDLEIADYERTISDLNSQLQKKSSEINEHIGDIENLKTKIEGLQEEIKFTENHKETEEKRADSLKVSLEETKAELNAVKDQKLKLMENITQLQLQLETLTQQNEEYKSHLSEASSEIEQLKEAIKRSADNHQKIVRSLENRVASQKQEINLSHAEIENVKQEFENYKIRVHSVLKQQKTVTPFSVDDSENKLKLESLNEKLKFQIKDLNEKLKALTLENDALREEHDHLLQRHNKVVEELEAKDQGWNKRLEMVTAEKTRLQLMHEEMCSQHALQSEMLAATYKKQIKIMQEDYRRNLQDLQKQLDAADIEISRLQREGQKMSSMPPSNINQDDFAFDILSQERQEGEGSECTDGANTPVKHLSLATIPTSGFLPFEKLIQSPAEPGTPSSYISNQDSEKLTTELTTSWKKIDHLSELLNDSEANNLRLTEQVRVLKEELRRLERNKQREEHAKNLEYLKNVLIKFATLPPGSEKSVLIPVLTTMLKLSPEEQSQLKSVSGGDSATDTDSSWGSYLHRWSGLA